MAVIAAFRARRNGQHLLARTDGRVGLCSLCGPCHGERHPGRRQACKRALVAISGVGNGFGHSVMPRAPQDRGITPTTVLGDVPASAMFDGLRPSASPIRGISRLLK